MNKKHELSALICHECKYQTYHYIFLQCFPVFMHVGFKASDRRLGLFYFLICRNIICVVHDKLLNRNLNILLNFIYILLTFIILSIMGNYFLYNILVSLQNKDKTDFLHYILTYTSIKTSREDNIESCWTEVLFCPLYLLWINTFASSAYSVCLTINTLC